MYDLLNDTAGREHHQELIKAAEQESFARKVESAQSKPNMLTQVRTALIRTLSAIVG